MVHLYGCHAFAVEQSRFFLYNFRSMEAGEYLAGIDYPGRIAVAGQDGNGKPVIIYAITGRSANSRNRVIVSDGSAARTMAFDESLVEDPSLIIYNAVRHVSGRIICTNGDHTDTIAAAFESGKELPDALVMRTYEPDAPSYTPRIGAVLNPDGSSEMFIIRRKDSEPLRLVWKYDPEPGVGHIIHTYSSSGNPLPSFSGMPQRVEMHDGPGTAHAIWESLDPEYRVALYALTAEGEMIINALEAENGKN